MDSMNEQFREINKDRKSDPIDRGSKMLAAINETLEREDVSPLERAFLEESKRNLKELLQEAELLFGRGVVTDAASA